MSKIKYSVNEEGGENEMIYRTLPTCQMPLQMLSKYSPVQGSELGLTDIRIMPFLSRNSYHWKRLALSPALHVTRAPTGLHGAVWVAQEEARGGEMAAPT